jgi:hypothetical protein
MLINKLSFQNHYHMSALVKFQKVLLPVPIPDPRTFCGTAPFAAKIKNKTGT